LKKKSRKRANNEYPGGRENKKIHLKGKKSATLDLMRKKQKGRKRRGNAREEERTARTLGREGRGTWHRPVLLLESPTKLGRGK